MAKKARSPINPTPAKQRPAWIGFTITGLIAAAAGAAIAISVRPNAAPPPAPATAVAAAPAATNAPEQPVSVLFPPPDLIMDLPPAKVALNLGNWSYDQKSWPAAVAYYNEAVKRGYGDNPDVLTDLGNAYRFSNQPQKALGEYALAQQKNPAHEQSLFNQGALYGDDLGDTKKAIDVWKQYLQRFPHGAHRDEAQHLIEITEAHSGINTSNAATPTAQ